MHPQATPSTQSAIRLLASTLSQKLCSCLYCAAPAAQERSGSSDSLDSLQQAARGETQEQSALSALKPLAIEDGVLAIEDRRDRRSEAQDSRACLWVEGLGEPGLPYCPSKCGCTVIC